MAKPAESVIAAASAHGPAAVVLGSRPPTLEDFTKVCAGREILLDRGAVARMCRSEGALADILAAGATVYGVTTAYGADSARRIEPPDRPAFQLATLRSHACGTGSPLAWSHARGVWFAKSASLATGLTGASAILAETMAGLLNAGFAPLVPSMGSLGASGDLIPSAHAALPLVGEGEVLTGDGTRLPAPDALAAAGLAPLVLGPRDGLSLVNGTAVTASLSAHAVVAAARLLQVAGALTAAGLETVGGHEAAFLPDITQARPQAGAHAAADAVRRWLAGADRRLLGRSGVHDPYAWRCVPQVHGAAADACQWATGACLSELASCTDNPVITAGGRIVSGGNFHAAPLGIPMDALRLGVGEVAALSRQRIAHLARHLAADDRLSGRAAGATGLTMVLTTATAALLEIGLSGPATGRWLPVDDVEDHVSNATVAARLTLDAVDHAWTVLAAEALSVAVCLQRVTPPAASAAVRWLSALLPGLDGSGEAIRLDRPLAALLARLRDMLTAVACEPPPALG